MDQDNADSGTGLKERVVEEGFGALRQIAGDIPSAPPTSRLLLFAITALIAIIVIAIVLTVCGLDAGEVKTLCVYIFLFSVVIALLYVAHDLVRLKLTMAGGAGAIASHNEIFDNEGGRAQD